VGCSQQEATRCILEHNLFGLDIDERAAQLAYFAVMMKARQYDRRIFSRGIQPHVYAIAESNGIDTFTRDYFANNDPKLKSALDSIISDLRDAKEYGSILTVAPVDFAALYARMDEVQNDISLYRESALNTILPLIRVAEIMAERYDVAITNPPYMAISSASAKLNDYINKNYIGGKTDLFSVFIERCLTFSKQAGYTSMITMQSWMFLTSFEKLRHKILSNEITTMAHLGARGFDEISGEVVQTTAFTVRKMSLNGQYTGTYNRLITGNSEAEKSRDFLSGKYRFQSCGKYFLQIPESIIAYWISRAVVDCFKNRPLSTIFVTREGMATADNDRFLRLWHEVAFPVITFDCESEQDGVNKAIKWVPYNKGGTTRDWYGNNEYIVNWALNGAEIKNNKDPKTGRIRSHNYNGEYGFKEGITWSAISSGDLSVRYCKAGFLFDSKGAKGFSQNEDNLLWVLGLLNSKVSMQFLQFLSPTLDFKVGDIISIPFVEDECKRSYVVSIVRNQIDLSKEDWDAFETSWDFKGHPLVLGRLPEPVWGDVPDKVAFQNTSLSYTYQIYWKKTCEYRFEKLKANEEELNRIFIDIYGLQDELTPEVADKDITVHRIFDTKDEVPESMQGSSYVRTKRDEVVSLLSYAVGCMFGRYSPDRQGLIFAGGDFDSVYWKFKGQAALNEQGDPIEGGYAGISLANYHYPKFHDAENWEDATSLSYEPDADGVIPITDEEYLEDDIVSRLCDWLKAVYGADTLEENLDFIAGALGGKGNSSREIIRNYFLKDFFKDHCKTYQKRPIYWLFDSGKQNGFKALIYLHRYTPDTIGNLRVDYLHKMQRVYESEINRMQDMIDNSTNAREIAASTKRKEKLQKQLKECRNYDEMIAHLALSRIELDLDDGVKVNYEKIQTASDGKKYAVLAKI